MACFVRSMYGSDPGHNLFEASPILIVGHKLPLFVWKQEFIFRVVVILYDGADPRMNRNHAVSSGFSLHAALDPPASQINVFGFDQQNF